MISKEEAYKNISELVDRFSEQFDSYKRSEYNETEQSQKSQIFLPAKKYCIFVGQ